MGNGALAMLKTDAEGRYRFKTIKPGAYPAPHIHFRLSGLDDELVTQMYFEGEPLNAQDRFLQSVPADRRALLIARLLPPPAELEPDSRLVVFDIVTLRGGWRDQAPSRQLDTHRHA